jgi:hypothetical protein
MSDSLSMAPASINSAGGPTTVVSTVVSSAGDGSLVPSFTAGQLYAHTDKEISAGVHRFLDPPREQ